MPGPIYHPTDCEVVGYGPAGGSVLLGAHREILSGLGAEYTFYRKQSGALVLFDAATQTYTLPTAVRGMEFEFMVFNLAGATAQKVVTAGATQFIDGVVTIATIAADGTVGSFEADAAATRSINMNGTTTGGLTGSRFILTCTATSRWNISGVLYGSGTLETGFATS